MDPEALHRVETPEYVVFEYELAGLVRRGLAWLLDALVIAVLVLAIYAGSFLLMPLAGGAALALALVLTFLVQWGYFAALEWAWRGQTLGKRATELRVILDTGVQVGFYQALVRNLLRILDALPATYLVGAVSYFATGRRQRLGDLLAGTVVVRDRKRPVPSAVIPPDERYNSFLEDPAARAAARSAVGPELREVLTALALRREEIEIQARLKLYRRLADVLQGLGVPRPRSLSDERYVLSATAAALATPDLAGALGPASSPR